MATNEPSIKKPATQGSTNLVHYSRKNTKQVESKIFQLSFEEVPNQELSVRGFHLGWAFEALRGMAVRENVSSSPQKLHEHPASPRLPTEDPVARNPLLLVSLLRATIYQQVNGGESQCLKLLTPQLGNDHVMEGMNQELEELMGVPAAHILLCADKPYTVDNLKLALQLAKAMTMNAANQVVTNGSMSNRADMKVDSIVKYQQVLPSRGGKHKRSHRNKVKCCKYGPAFWCKKYFWEGQELQKPVQDGWREELARLPWHKRFLIQHRRLLGFAIPALIFNVLWWSTYINKSYWYLFQEKYPMTITMVIGSIIAGMTSEGGGAVAFPVMTLALKVKPSIARDFSIMIQSVGMTSALFTIFFMRVRIEWHSILCCTIGGFAGLVFGLHVVDPAMSAAVKKLGFVSIWFAFASVLIFLNRTSKRRTFNTIPNFNWWKVLVLVAFGFIGGIFTSFSGNGLDISSFMVLTLLFRISEKIATPTSVILMAINSVLGFYWRAVVMTEPVDRIAWEYFSVCVPVVVLGAPVGSVLGSHFHRLILAALVILLDTLALVGAFAIVRPLTAVLVGCCVAVIIFCFFLFMAFTFVGQKMLDRIEAGEKINCIEMNEPEEIPEEQKGCDPERYGCYRTCDGSDGENSERMMKNEVGNNHSLNGKDQDKTQASNGDINCEDDTRDSLLNIDL